MEEKKEVIDVSKESFKDELAKLSIICDKLNLIYMRNDELEDINTDTEKKEEEISEKGRVLK